MKVFHCKLLTYRSELGGYVLYVFRNLDAVGVLDRYIMCTKHPNWQTPPIGIGQEGYVKIKEIEAGKDTWYNQDSGEVIPYKYSGVQFFEFVLDKHEEPEECVMI